MKEARGLLNKNLHLEVVHTPGWLSRFEFGLVRAWFGSSRFDFGLVRVGSRLIRDWFEFGSSVVRVGSSLVRVWFEFGSSWFEFASSLV